MEIRSLNSLRGLAVLIVIISHYSNHTEFLNQLLGAGAGQFGVMIFFLLSAFLITILYSHRPPAQANLKNYILARFARVVPLFLMVVFLSLAANLILPKPFSGIFYKINDLRTLVEHLALFRGASVLWTIAPEIQFYGIFILLWWASRWIGKASFLFPAAAIVFYLANPELPKFSGEILGLNYNLHLIRVYPYFCMGMLLGLLYLLWDCPEAVKSHKYVLVLAFIPILYPNIMAILTGQDTTDYQFGLWYEIAIFGIMSAIFFIILFLVPAGNILVENKIGDFLGRVSYSAYLLHQPVFLAMKKIGLLSGWFGAMLSIGLVFIISHYVFKLIEDPARRSLKTR